MTYDFYLQGSYRNDTNLQGDSDVDVVLEMNSAFQYDLNSISPYERDVQSSSFQSATHTWNDFRREALKALETGFGRALVSQGNKSIKLKAHQPRLAADIVVCMEHRKYTSYNRYVSGITFYALQDKCWVVNYPKLHYDHGADKSRRTWDRYKRTVRMFKSARNRLEEANLIGLDLAPSYSLECLLYNAPDSAFQVGFQDTYCSIVNWLNQSNLTGFICQNRQQYLFGDSDEKWSVTEAKALGGQLANLWNNWS